MFSLNILRHYFCGVHIDVFTNQKCLQYVFTTKYLNIRKRMWLKLLIDYDIKVLYHPVNANVVASSLCRMTMGSVFHIE